MTQRVSATIIPFPARNQAVLATGETAQAKLTQSTARLSVALANLTTALNEQREAAERWRDALTTLSTRMQKIGTV